MNSRDENHIISPVNDKRLSQRSGRGGGNESDKKASSLTHNWSGRALDLHGMIKALVGGGDFFFVASLAALFIHPRDL